MRTLRLSLAGLCTFAMALALTGCSGMSDWDWFGMKKKKEPTKPVTKARRPVEPPAKSQADERTATAAPEDEKSKEVDERVNRYVQSMNKPNYDTSYESNDFQSKIQRQKDPNRATRIRQTAAASRDTSAPWDSSPASSEQSQEPQAPEAPKNAERQPVSIPPETGNSNEDAESLETETPDQLGVSKSPEPVDRSADLPKEKTEPSPSANDKIEPAPAEPEPAAQREVEPPAKTEPIGGAKSEGSKPPVLKSITVAADPTPAEPSPDSTAEKAKPAANEPPPTVVSVDEFKKKLEAQEAVVAKDPNNVEEQFKLRMMYLANGQDEKALSNSNGVNGEVQEIMLAQLKTLIAARSTAGRDPSAWANRQLQAVEDLRKLVRSRADLQIPRIALCSSIQGFGVYTPIEPAEFKVGRSNRILLYIEVDNFSTERTASGLHRTLLTLRQALLNPQGQELWSAKDENIEDLARQFRRDFYLSAERMIPKTLPAGEYTFKVEVEDVIAGKMNSGSVKFKLVP